MLSLFLILIKKNNIKRKKIKTMQDINFLINKKYEEKESENSTKVSGLDSFCLSVQYLLTKYFMILIWKIILTLF